MKIKIEITKKQLAYLKSLDSKKKKRKFLLDCLVEEIEVKNPKAKAFLEHVEDFLKEESILRMKGFKEIKLDEILEKSKEPQPPTEFCVKITDENKGILETAYYEFNTVTNVSFRAKYLHANSIDTYMFTSDLIQGSLLVTTEQFLKYIGREDLVEKTETQKINDLFFKELEAKRESLLSDVKKLFSDYESKEQGISVLCDLSKIGFFIDEDVLDKYHESAKKK